MGFPVDVIFPQLMATDKYDTGTLAASNSPVDAARSLLPSDVNTLSADFIQEKINSLQDILTGDKKLPITVGEPDTLEFAGQFFLASVQSGYELRFKWPGGSVTTIATSW
jgi:hypothetical protein